MDQNFGYVDHYVNIREVVQKGLCTGCGTCEGVCPKDAVEMVIDSCMGIYIPQLNQEICSNCGLCLDVCPGHAVDFEQLNLEIFGKQPNDFLLGNYLNCYTGYATDYDVRYNSASGGLVTALLIFALENGLIDGALVTRMKEDKPLEPQPFIARTREEILSAARSKYCPVPTNLAVKEILDADEGEKFAVVGLPCHLHGIRKADTIMRKLRERVVLHFGIVCTHAPSFLATEYVLSRKHIKPTDVIRLDYRGDGWPGYMKVTTVKGEYRMFHHDYWAKGFGTSFCPLRCSFCCDQTAELADITFADAWLPELVKDNVGTSIIVSRTAAGENIMQMALSKNQVVLEHLPAQKAKASQWSDINFKKTVKARFNLYRMAGGREKIPIYKTQLLGIGLGAYLKGTSHFVRRFCGSKRYLWHMIYLESSLKHLPVKLLRRNMGLYTWIANLKRKIVEHNID